MREEMGKVKSKIIKDILTGAVIPGSISLSFAKWMSLDEVLDNSKNRGEAYERWKYWDFDTRAKYLISFAATAGMLEVPSYTALYLEASNLIERGEYLSAGLITGIYLSLRAVINITTNASARHKRNEIRKIMNRYNIFN